MQAGNATVYAGSWRHPATEHGFLTASYYEKLGPHPRRGLLRHDVLRRPPGHARHLRRVGGRGRPPRGPPGEARPEHRARRPGRPPPGRSASGATYSTTYYSPFHVARTFATLDHLTGGRAAWNVVTSVNDSEAQNFGVDQVLAHDERYDRADEFLEATTGLWDTLGGRRARPRPGQRRLRRSRQGPRARLRGRVVQGPRPAHRAALAPGPAGAAPGRFVGSGPRLRRPLGRADLHRRPRHRGGPVPLQGPEGAHRPRSAAIPTSVKMLPMAYTVVGESTAHAQEREQVFLNDSRRPDGLADPAVRADELRLLRASSLDAPITDELIESVSGIRGLVQNLRTHIGGDTSRWPTWPATAPRCCRAPASSAPGPRWPTRWRSGSTPTPATASSSPPPTRPAPTRTWSGWSCPSCSAAACSATATPAPRSARTSGSTRPECVAHG